MATLGSDGTGKLPKTGGGEPTKVKEIRPY